MRLPDPDTPLDELMAAAAALRDVGHPRLVTYSRKVFIPLTRLCRDVCHYCTFAKTPRHLAAAYLSPEEILALAERGAAAGCQEALFTLGDRPETRYAEARDALVALGYDSTVAYLRAMAARVLERTGLLPHINAGVLTEAEYRTLREVAPSMGLMLESSSERLMERGGPHFGSPDKHPAVRLESIGTAGRLRIPFTSGLLVGIGETRAERLESLVALRRLQEQHGHIQEVIIQNFLPKPDTKMRAAPAATESEMLWTVAMARLVLGPEMSIQAPPNLNPQSLAALIGAGINDWGGISPVTPDHVNPERPWPHLESLRGAMQRIDRVLTERLTVYPRFVTERAGWIDRGLHRAVLHHADASGLARTDRWRAGVSVTPPTEPDTGIAAAPRASATAATLRRSRPSTLDVLLVRAAAGDALPEEEILQLFAVRGADLDEVLAAADAVRRERCGDTVSYVVNRNINYTNLCTYHCGFCAFSKGRASAGLRGKGYLLELDEITRRTAEAADRGATEVCLQGGIHPSFTGQTYLDICRAAKGADPDIHVHAFSPLEVQHGAATLRLPVARFLERLQAAGLATLPGTAAEILDDGVRRELCPDKLSTQEWLAVVEAAHRVGLRTTATILFGHIEAPLSWARHLLAIRALQARTGGFTEFVALPFVAEAAPIYLKGAARPGPTWREARLMHAVARLVLHPLIANIQASWVKLGPEGAGALLHAGVNDLGGTLMNESISRAAGAAHGQELSPQRMRSLIRSHGRMDRQRTTLYGVPDSARERRSFGAPSLVELAGAPHRIRAQA
ncbi:MAG: 5-amino-6-(D-ribitylamino)uracil--L-tyrosine 4-hydroxyphenyl transferase CofH [Steroidobacteraceae bacterium]